MAVMRSILRPVLQPILRSPLEAAISKQIIDVDIGVGQSNMVGHGNSALSPECPTGLYIEGSTISSPLNDPVGDAATGSMVPALGNEYNVQTGRRLAYVAQAVGGTSLLAAADGGQGNWSPTGTLRAAAVAAANDAIAAISASGLYAVGRVRFLWCGGEADSEAVNGTTVTGALYSPALVTLADYLKAQVPEMERMDVIRTGTNTYAATTHAKWLEIRQAQEAACTDSDNLRMVYRGASSFTALGYKADTEHWNQTGLNITGKCSGREQAKETETAALTAPAYLASSTHSYIDPSVAVASHTHSHTTAVGTKTLIVAAQAHRYSNSGLQTGGTLTANGVAMTRLRTVGAGGTTPAGKDIVSIFAMTETEYGAPLGGVTFSLVHTPSSSQPQLQMAAVDVDKECVLDWYVDGSITGGATGSSIAATMNATLPSFVIGVASSTSAGTTPTTAIIAGMTELLDGGGNNATNSGQAVIGYKTMSESVGEDTGITFSGTVGSAAFTVVGFRAKIDGE